MNQAIIYDCIRTPIGKYGGALASIRTDDLAALSLSAIMRRNPSVDWDEIDDVILGCANQAGEDNRNVARMAALLAGLPQAVSGCTVNRLCGSGMEAVGQAARTIRCGEGRLVVAGGVESMSRAPFVMAKAESAYDRNADIYDTTLGWRFINPLMKQQYGVDSMPQTAENVAEEFDISRKDQDAFALRSQQRAARAMEDDVLAQEIEPVQLTTAGGDTNTVELDQHPRASVTLQGLAKLATPFREGGTVTAGNASGLNDGSCALLIGNARAGEQYGLVPMARIIGMATAGVAPRVMGMGPVPASRKVLEMVGLSLAQMDVIELNEAFAAQALAVIRELGLPDDAGHINPNGGAIALGHPLGMSGARLVTSAVRQLQRQDGRYALCTMCIGVGQGIAMVLESCSERVSKD